MLLTAIGGIVPAMFGQSLLPQASADLSWSNVANPLGAVTSTNSTNNSGAIISPVAQEVAQYQAAAQAANGFYSSFPTDARAPSAKKLEVIYALESVELGGSQQLAQQLVGPHGFVGFAVHREGY